MADRQETIADIIAEMNRVEVCADGEPCLRDYARRFDAAMKREVDALNEQITDLRQQRDLWSKRSAELVEKCNEHYAKLKQVGNAAKLREAVAEAQKCANGALLAISHENVPIQHMWDIIDVCKAALAAPARNCDVGTTEEQSARMRKFCSKNGLCRDGSYRCENCGFLYDPNCELSWAQMPYEPEEGGDR